MKGVIAAAVLLGVCAPAAWGAASGQDRAYEVVNARLSRSTPHFPTAVLLTQEPVWGDTGSGRFEAVQRVYSLPRRQTQRAVTAFYAERLGAGWKRRGASCHVSGSRLVVALLHRSGRRLGVLVDSRGAASCSDERTLLTHLLNVGQ
jgi:hypothetical protein